MKFLSVCSGIEAASVAWNPLGWSAAAFSEIEPFPCAVLAHHYRTVPNLGDMTAWKEWNLGPVDLLCGGTPCQSFSVAGLRKGLDDPRGNLMLVYGAIAAQHRPRWLVWENVPGVLSSNGGRDFGSFLGLLGLIGYGFAYRVLDAQFFGVAQRRRRVFVVGCLGDWRSAAAVLFERHGLQGRPAPRREARQEVAGTVAGGARKRGGYRADDIPAVAATLTAGVKNGGAGHGARSGHAKDSTLIAFGGNRSSGPLDVATALSASASASASASGRMDFASETFIAHALTGEGFDASEDGTGRGTPLVSVMPFDTTQITSPHDRAQPDWGRECHTLAKGSHAPAIAYSTKLHNTASNQAGKVYAEYTAGLDANSPPPALLTASQVRRLTPVECCRLQGFPDDYLDIIVHGKPAADGPRYKALGNSWAVPNVHWIGRRIVAVDALKAAA